MTEFDGTCHCGAVAVRFATENEDRLEARACQCTFCRRHGAKTLSDPDGRVVIAAAPDVLGRYRFGLGSADYLICRRCGCYAGAIMGDGHSGFATINVAGLGMAPFADCDARPVVLDDEAGDAKRRRREAMWTPARIVEDAKAPV